jgi:membrane protein
MRIQAVLFDIDGTLVDSNEQHVDAWTEAFRTAGVLFERQRIHDQIGKGTDMLVPTLLPDADKAEQDRLGTVQGDVFRDRFLHDIRPFEGAREVLQRVSSSGQQVVLASSASKSEVDHYVDLLGVRDLVAASTSADDVEHTKPAPDIFESALAKVAAIGLRSGKFPDEVLIAAGAVAVYDDVATLLRDYDNSPLAS